MGKSTRGGKKKKGKHQARTAKKTSKVEQNQNKKVTKMGVTTTQGDAS